MNNTDSNPYRGTPLGALWDAAAMFSAVATPSDGVVVFEQLKAAADILSQASITYFLADLTANNDLQKTIVAVAETVIEALKRGQNITTSESFSQQRCDDASWYHNMFHPAQDQSNSG